MSCRPGFYVVLPLDKILDRTTKTPNWEGRGTYLLLCLKKGDGGSFLAACGASVLKTPVTVEWL
jgi:hypothetical protein